MKPEAKQIDIQFEQWQIELVNRLLLAIIIIAPPILIFNMLTTMPTIEWQEYLAIYVVVLALRFIDMFNSRIRMLSVIGLFFFLGLLLTANEDISSDVRLYFTIAVLLAGFFFGALATWVTFFCSVIVLLALGFAGYLSYLSNSLLFENDPVWFIGYVSDYIICAGIGLYSVSLMLNKMRLNFAELNRKVSESNLLLKEEKESKEQYQFLAQNMTDMVWIVDLDFNLTFISPSVIHLWGHTVEEALDIGLQDMTPPDVFSQWKPMLAGVLKQDNSSEDMLKTRRVEARIIHKDGHEIDVEQSIRFILDDSSNPIALLGTTREIGERKLLEHAMESVLKGTEDMLGSDFFESLASNLIKVLNVDAVVIGELTNNKTVKTLTFNLGGKTQENFEYPLSDTPCEQLIANGECTYFPDLNAKFPEVHWLLDAGFTSYLGITINNANGEAIGQIAAIRKQAIDELEMAKKLLVIFASHAGAEMMRSNIESEKELIRHQLLQSQKIESVGQLAGGVAHDFNNLLVVISGYAEIAQQRKPADQKLSEALRQIRTAADRATELTRQLLSFSRRQIMEFKTLDLNALIGNLKGLLARLLPENIDYQFIPGKNLPTISGDPGQLDQAIINLCVNASDAMPDGGQLRIETNLADATQKHQNAFPWIETGQHIVITVSDSGCGISKELHDRIFEPFFTTKEDGQGTGLGLSVLIGIIKQHRGFVLLNSEINQGASFEIYLPVTSGSIKEPQTSAKLESGAKGSETILLVEDEEQVRLLAKRILLSDGYQVIVAEDGEQALEQFRTHKDTLALVFLDVILPKLSGHEVMKEIKSQRPHLPILFTSGYAASGIHTNFILQQDLELLQKPYTVSDLTGRVRAMIDAVAKSGST